MIQSLSTRQAIPAVLRVVESKARVRGEPDIPNKSVQVVMSKLLYFKDEGGFSAV